MVKIMRIDLVKNEIVLEFLSIMIYLIEDFTDTILTRSLP